MITSTPELVDFDGLRIAFDQRVLRPRPWTVAQSRWAAELLPTLPAGPVLELCTGAGQIGLAAVRRTDRPMVCVDLDPVAAAFARDNAREAGLDARVEVRVGPLDGVLHAGETFGLVIADPPWVVHDQIGTFPEDPPLAIDGGADGLAVARLCLDVAAQHLAEGGQVLLQLGSADQVTVLLDTDSAALTCREVREYDGGVVARLSPELRD
jgi:release factor glutamine methyltransferase